MTAKSFLYSKRPKRERRRYPVCRRVVAVDVIGVLARHGAEHDAAGECAGSGAVARAFSRAWWAK
ncbi:MAG: hypothetical protein ACLP3C_03385 [Mycobacterium sp.]|uniref:hypothetical protein n=1 Tax=Mycobacterium sp. TaxID=1785 RepID=UPI003F98555E